MRSDQESTSQFLNVVFRVMASNVSKELLLF